MADLCEVPWTCRERLERLKEDSKPNNVYARVNQLTNCLNSFSVMVINSKSIAHDILSYLLLAPCLSDAVCEVRGQPLLSPKAEKDVSATAANQKVEALVQGKKRARGQYHHYDAELRTKFTKYVCKISQ